MYPKRPVHKKGDAKNLWHCGWWGRWSFLAPGCINKKLRKCRLNGLLKQFEKEDSGSFDCPLMENPYIFKDQLKKEIVPALT
jgi:hypothetical protein